MGGAIASSCGPVLGGALTLVMWRAIFYINVPAAVIALMLLARTGRSPHRKVAFDTVGQVTAVVAMGGLTYAAIEAGAAGLTDARVVIAFSVAAAAFAVFLLSQAQGAHPMMPLELFRNKNVSIAVAVGFAFVVGYYGLPFVMSLYLQQQRGLSALGAGLAFLPMMLTGLALTPFSARIAERAGVRLVVCGGLALMTIGHAHSIGQALYVTEGEGLVQARGQAAIRIRPGDVVDVAGSEWHWHGAAPDHLMTHLSLTEGETEWGDHVTDAEYEGP